MRKIFKRVKGEQGAVVVEAAISLTTFMFAIAIIIKIIQICTCQMIVGTTICGVAQDISKFSYLYEVTGLAEKRQGLGEKASAADEAVTNLKKSIEEMNFKGASDTIKSAANNPDIFQSLLYLAVDSGIDYGASQGMAYATEKLFESRVSNEYESASEMLNRIGIVDAVGGKTGINFKDSHFCENAKSGASTSYNDIIIVAKYKVHVIDVLGFDYDFEIQQAAATKSWPGVSWSSSGDGDGGDK